MQIKLKKHEILLASLMALLAMFNYVGKAASLSTGELAYFKDLFLKHQLAFNPFKNIILPQIGTVLLLLSIYLYINLIMIPYFKKSGVRSIFPYITLAIQLTSLSFILCIGINAASYYANPAWFSYGRFQILSILGYNETPLRSLFQGFERAIIIVLIYTLYAVGREYLISKIKHTNTQKEYKILISNQISTFLFIYLLVPISIATFQIIQDPKFFTGYFIVATSAIPIFFINTYSIFPQLSSAAKARLSTFLKLIFITLALSFPFVLLLIPGHRALQYTWLLNWMLQMLVFTPLSYLVYTQQKDQITQLRGTQNQLSKSKADLQFLRSQINPHFLFNALNTLYGTALVDGSKRTAEGIQKLGDMMRFMLDDNHLDFIPLMHEVSYINNYLDIQKLRMAETENIKITANLEIANSDARIVPMLLLPLVENAFKHGIDLEKNSWINIVLDNNEETLRFKVRNSYHGIDINDPERKQSGIGLRNVEERLEIFYNKAYKFTHEIVDNEYIAEIIIKHQPKQTLA